MERTGKFKVLEFGRVEIEEKEEISAEMKRPSKESLTKILGNEENRSVLS